MRDGRIVEVMEVVGVEGSRVLFERYLPLHDTVLKRYRVALLTLSRSTRPLNSLSISTLSDMAKGHGSAKRHTPATTSPASQKLPVRRPQSTHGLIMCPKLRQLPHAANR